MSLPSFKNLSSALKSGKIVVIPTDTIYGIVGSALIRKTVEKIYQLRKRNLEKPFIILISDLNDLNHFNIKLSQKQKDLLQKIWPNPVSVILPVTLRRWNYLHRGTQTLAFRMPKNENLLELLARVGPLVAPSANFEGEKSAQTLQEAKRYFGNNVDLYLDGGKLMSKPSTIVQLQDEKLSIIRQGAFMIS